MSKATIVITGGAGFLGSHLAERYLRKGWTVWVVDDLSRIVAEVAGVPHEVRYLDRRPGGPATLPVGPRPTNPPAGRRILHRPRRIEPAPARSIPAPAEVSPEPLRPGGSGRS